MYFHKKIRRSRPSRIFKKLSQRASELLVKHGQIKSEDINIENGEYVIWFCSSTMDGTEWDYHNAYDWLCHLVMDLGIKYDEQGNYIDNHVSYKNPSAYFKAFNEHNEHNEHNEQGE